MTCLRSDNLRCACGSPVFNRKRGLCKYCYQQEYRVTHYVPKLAGLPALGSPCRRCDSGSVAYRKGGLCAKCRAREIRGPSQRDVNPRSMTCINCGEDRSGQGAKDRCFKCWRYEKRHGIERPAKFWGRKRIPGVALRAD
jgi:hypothetical protein